MRPGSASMQAPAVQSGDAQMMTEPDVLAALDAGEDTDVEFKSGRGGVPASLWDTYCAMANTNGGLIILGIEEAPSGPCVAGVDDPAGKRKTIFDTAANRSAVSVNLLTENDVTTYTVDGATILVVHVRRATRQERPVYRGANPMAGTYRRRGEGDYRCDEVAVSRMYADRSEEGHDSAVLEHFGLEDLDRQSVEQYRHRFAANRPHHPYLERDLTGFLRGIKAWRLDRRAGRDGLTLAGLLMFGKPDVITDPLAVQQFHLDYRERFSDDPVVRHTDRLTDDGTWACNVYQFANRAYDRLTRDLAVPFRLDSDSHLFRQDETPVHEAIREALINALIHADYRGVGGVVVERHRNRYEFSNPGTLLLSEEQMREGSLSECRNKSLQSMFFHLGWGEKEGTGYPKIRNAWREQNWRAPRLEESVEPARVTLVLETVSLLPPEALDELRRRCGDAYAGLSALEIQALTTALLESGVSNARMRQLCDEHPTDITRLLQGLVSRGLLAQVGRKRGTTYRLLTPGDRSSGDNTPGSGDSAPGSGDSAPGSGDNAPGSGDWEELQRLAERVSLSRRAPRGVVRDTLLQLCSGRYLTLPQLAELLARRADTLRQEYLAPMVREGVVVLRYRTTPNHPQQAYTTAAEHAPGDGGCGDMA